MFVASSVYGFETELMQICACLTGYGYEVWNSHYGTVKAHPARSNLENCLAAVDMCDAFLGIVRPFYGSGIIERKGNWCQPFSRFAELLGYIRNQLSDVREVRRIVHEMRKP